MADDTIPSPHYQEGLKLGKELAEGHSQEARQELSQYVQRLERNERDPEIVRQQKADLMAGMRVADPTDVHLVRDEGYRAHYQIDWDTENFVNHSFQLLNDSRGNQSASFQSPANSFEEAIKRVNLYLGKHLPPTNQSDFVADFNRRSAKNDALSKFEAYQSGPAQVRIRSGNQ